MNEQKNLFLAIGLSILIIVAFQFLFPQQAIMTPSSQQTTEQVQQAPSTEEQQKVQNISITKSKEEVVVLDKRVLVDAPSLKGSINLKGAILDDLLLIKYKESLDKRSKNINLFYPDQTANPYYLEIGWKSQNGSSEINLPNAETQWQTSGSTLSPATPVTLQWTNNDNITFKIHYEIDEHYMLQINQEINNNSIKTIKVFPYRVIKRINLPDTINFFILHEGLISLLNEELLEKKYKDLLGDCSESFESRNEYCGSYEGGGGWLYTESNDADFMQ